MSPAPMQVHEARGEDGKVGKNIRAVMHATNEPSVGKMMIIRWLY